MAKECPYRFHLPPSERACTQHQCEFYIHLVGMNPQTGQPTDEWGCTFRWLPILLTENASQIRQAAASTDKVATEIKKSRAEFIGALSDEAKERLMQNNVKLLE